MPGYAGSSWYFLRYMDPHNEKVFCDRAASDYWNQVDLYVGGTEHAVGHLLYSRMWTKVLCDLGHIGFDEPYKKLLNQGMIQGSSRMVYRINYEKIKLDDLEELVKFCLSQTVVKGQESLQSRIRVNLMYILNLNDGVDRILYPDEIIDILLKKGEKGLIEKLREVLVSKENYCSIKLPPKFFSLNEMEKSFSGFRIEKESFDEIHIDVNFCDGLELDIEKFKAWKAENADAIFQLENGKYICGSVTEKMSKRLYNTVNPNDLCDRFGADTFRMYEMFLGPVEQSKPWDTKGIEGVHRFLRKLWRLFFDDIKGKVWNEDKASDAELKVLHRTIRKIDEDTEKFSYNTAVSAFMVCVNELQDLKCHKKEVLQQVLVLLTPYAPHIAEELWSALGNAGSILDVSYPVFEEKYVTETSKAYPIAINGKPRAEINIALDATQEQVEALVLADATVQKWLEGKTPKKIIYVRNKMVNIVP
jgi:leucyl-tRNA synthetase